MNFRDIEDRRLKTCEDAIVRLQKYSESKNDDMFDILYNSHINVITQLLSIEISELLDSQKKYEIDQAIKNTMVEIVELLNNKYSNTKFKFRNDDFLMLIHNNPYLQNCKNHDEIIDVVFDKANEDGIGDDILDRFCIRYEKNEEIIDVKMD